MIRRWLLDLRLLVRGIAATRYAARRGAPGVEFAAFGRRIGLHALLAGDRAGLDLLLTPVNIVRYWELPFVIRNLAERPGKCLDVASPRLLSYYVARNLEPEVITIINPDHDDADLTTSLAKAAGIGSLEVDPIPVEALASHTERYDSVWSVSVIEHIPGEGDTAAMRTVYAALAKGGRAIVTIPVDRETWIEYRDQDAYGLGHTPGPEGYYFQRWYDEASIRARLIEPIRPTSVRMEWFGERVAGRFAAYERDWMKLGHSLTVSDPREIADWYATYPRWADMPGQGVCGLVIEKGQ